MKELKKNAIERHELTTQPRDLRKYFKKGDDLSYLDQGYNLSTNKNVIESDDFMNYTGFYVY